MTNIKMRADTSAPVLLKFHSAISMNVKDNMKDKLTSHIYYTQDVQWKWNS